MDNTSQTNSYGNRIVNIEFYTQNVIRLSETHARSCTLGNLIFESEKHFGLNCCITLKCNTCEKVYTCSTDSQDTILNQSMVWGTISSGSTYKHSKEFLSVLNIPCISANMFYNIQDNLREVNINKSKYDNI